jgi:cytochrome c oxidase subunit 3/cytochrome o ubiquinol oxidase subunit 3
MLSLVAIFGFAGEVRASQSGRVAVLSMYWHFVDAVWVVVFTVVYVLGR